MKIVIIEDEKPAAGKLTRSLEAIDPSLYPAAVLGSVNEAAEWLAGNGSPDLIFMDIELSDGLSFQLFDRVKVTCPVIFTTAFDEYWQEAFEHNSIDYLLKPVKEEKLKAALNKYEKLRQYFSVSLQKITTGQLNGRHKKRFLVKRGADLVSIRSEDIAYFYATHKLICLVGANGQKYILDQSLSDLEKQTDPALFYRVNRKYLVSMNAIRRIRAYPKGKLLLEVEPGVEEEVIVSQETAGDFKRWMEG